MFNIGAGEIALIMVAALLILGPKRLPELARGIGKFLREFRRQTDDVRSMVEREFYKMDQEVDPAPQPPIAQLTDAADHAGLLPPDDPPHPTSESQAALPHDEHSLPHDQSSVTAESQRPGHDSSSSSLGASVTPTLSPPHDDEATVIEPKAPRKLPHS